MDRSAYYEPAGVDQGASCAADWADVVQGRAADLADELVKAIPHVTGATVRPCSGSRQVWIGVQTRHRDRSAISFEVTEAVAGLWHRLGQDIGLRIQFQGLTVVVPSDYFAPAASPLEARRRWAAMARPQFSYERA
ncbi:MAG: hypothetical protein ACT4PW_01030 [Acidimicrobiia bacterium]